MSTTVDGERFLVTGAHGCIGAWVVRQLLSEGTSVVALDVSDDSHRLQLLLSPDELACLETVRTDITDLRALEVTLDEHEITNIIHLAALQVPFCRADPPLGACVNVVGTVNVLEAAVRRKPRMAPVVYASSIAVYSDISPEARAAGERPSADGALPGTLYGVYKRANEGAAALYWRDQGLASVGLRPHTVYGPGRDQGVTSSPTAAMLATAAGRPFEIAYGGTMQMQYAPDVATAFIRASRSHAASATVHNLTGHSVHMAEVVRAIEAVAPEAAGRITFNAAELSFPSEVDSASLVEAFGLPAETSLEDGVADTIRRFRELIDAQLLSPPGNVSGAAR